MGQFIEVALDLVNELTIRIEERHQFIPVDHHFTPHELRKVQDDVAEHKGVNAEV